MGKILDTKKIIEIWEKELINRMSKLEIKPELNIIVVGNREESKLYVDNKIKKASSMGIKTTVIRLPEDINQEYLNEVISNMDKPTILQLPLPDNLSSRKAINNLDYRLDVDGLTTFQKGLLSDNDERAYIPATAFGIIKMIKYDRDIVGKKVSIISRSELIGEPLSKCILRMNGYPVILHSVVNDMHISSETISSDVIVSGCGRRKIFNSYHVSDDQLIIDCSMYKDPNIPGVGDFDKEDILQHTNATIASGYGHTGPATIMGLLDNVIRYYELYN